MKLRLLLPLLFSGILFGLFLLIPVEWFTSLSKHENIKQESTSLDDSVLKGIHSQEEMLKSNKYYPVLAQVS
ncbi:Poly(glycerophosphate chain) D-alanine transfer protein DltD [Staphylococcus aureus]|nr:Poly(glycerophosphate chain) D-alanine transfer protein DltD [Staphylococcus aureus]